MFNHGGKVMFDEFFEVFLADTEEGMETHYHLRYKVYCEEMGYEDKNLFSKELERDEWDKHSVHFIVRHKETGQWVGAMRMVYQNNAILPLQEFCSIAADVESKKNNIEISRLCLVKEIRRRKTDNEPPLSLDVSADTSHNNKDIHELYSRRHINKSLIWGLFRAASVYSQEKNIDNWYFLGTKALARVITREGFKMRQVGDGCDHRGMRYPFKVKMEDIINNSIWSKGFQQGYRLYSELESVQQALSKVA